MSRLGRSQPVQPTVWHGPDDAVPEVPASVQFVPLDADRHHQRPTQQPFVGVHGFDTGVAAAVTPPAPLSVERVDQRVRYLPLAPTSIVGIPADQFAPAVITPPAPFNVDRLDQRVRFLPLAPTSIAGIPVDQFSVITPPEPVNLDRADQRVRYRPLDPISISGILAALVPSPTVTPPGPFVVPLDERRRFLAALPPEFNVGFDDVAPPDPRVVEQDDSRHRRPPLDPFTTTPGAAATTPTPATPPPPFVVPIDQRGRFLVSLPSTGQHGFVDPGPGPVGTTPPPVLNVDRPRLDPRYTPLQAVSASGRAPAAGENPTGGTFEPNYVPFFFHS